MIILELPQSEQLYMNDKNESSVKDIFRNLPDDMEVIVKNGRGKVIDILKVNDIFDI